MMKNFEIKAYAIYKKLEEEKCESEELTKFSEYLTKVLKEKAVTADITRDDIEWFNVYAFLLKKIENRERGEDSNIRNGEWRNIGADFEKLKFIIEELEAVRAIDQVNWSTGGGAYFIILDTREFKRLIFRKGIHKLKDLGISPQKFSETSSSNKLEKLIDKTHSIFTKNKTIVILITLIFLISSFISIADYINNNNNTYAVGIQKNESSYSMATPRPVLTNSSAPIPFNDSYNYIEKQTYEVANVRRGETERLFGGNLSISLISTSFEGYPYRYKIFATVGSPGHTNLEIKGKEVGDVIIYNGTDTFEIRITKTETFRAEFTVRRK